MIDFALDLLAPSAVNAPKAAVLQYALAPVYMQVRAAASLVPQQTVSDWQPAVI
jgi:hypothetical protein